MEKVAIIDGLRTPIGEYGGSLKNFSASELGSMVVKKLLERTEIKGEQIDEVIMGNVLQAGQGQNPARQVVIQSGLPITVPAFTINKVCGSGLKAIHLAAQAVALGEADIVIAGGMENMSQCPYLLKKARWGYKMGNDNLVDAMIYDGLWCTFNKCHMGVTAENIANKYSISREEQDKFAVWSQQKAEKANAKELLNDEILPITISSRKNRSIIVSADEHPRSGITMEKLANLKPVFKENGTVTAGNSSGINDGAAAVIVMSEKKAKEMGLKPKAYISAFASAGVEPSLMGLGPIPATQKVMKKSNLNIDELDLIEANEAFAVQILAVEKELRWDRRKVNVNGGAIAFGHPIGASGAKLLVSLIYEMNRRDSKRGLVTLCIGGGQGIATIIER